MLNITQTAQRKLAEVLASNPQFKIVRVGVRGGGCSGMEYQIALAEQPDPDWELVSENVYVDPISLMYIDGTTVDYTESLTESGFKFSNPNVRSQCGCGKSFSA